jgi:hypothetical protein
MHVCVSYSIASDGDGPVIGDNDVLRIVNDWVLLHHLGGAECLLNLAVHLYNVSIRSGGRDIVGVGDRGNEENHHTHTDRHTQTQIYQ